MASCALQGGGRPGSPGRPHRGHDRGRRPCHWYVPGSPDEEGRHGRPGQQQEGKLPQRSLRNASI
eukprot:scaffold396591_cov32-Prasinocladus_malaysianus.AAC.1